MSCDVRSSASVLSPPVGVNALQKKRGRPAQARQKLNVEMIFIPGRTPLDDMSVSPAARLAYAKFLTQLASRSLGLTAAPTELAEELSWGDAIATVLLMGVDPDELDAQRLRSAMTAFGPGSIVRSATGSTRQ